MHPSSSAHILFQPNIFYTCIMYYLFRISLPFHPNTSFHFTHPPHRLFLSYTTILNFLYIWAHSIRWMLFLTKFLSEKWNIESMETFSCSSLFLITFLYLQILLGICSFNKLSHIHICLSLSLTYRHMIWRSHSLPRLGSILYCIFHIHSSNQDILIQITNLFCIQTSNIMG